MYKLVIAEKPSVAQSIAKVLGVSKREDGFISGDKYLVSWCVGHLVGLSSPEMYDEKYKAWNLRHYRLSRITGCLALMQRQKDNSIS